MKLYMCKNKIELEKVSLDLFYRWRFFEDGDEKQWAEILFKTEEFKTKEAALLRFKNEFGNNTEELSKSCIFLETKDGESVGTIMACQGEFFGQEVGRIHWLSIVPNHQGKGLSSFLLNKATEILFDTYDLIYLSTQSRSEKAINLYLNYEFKPYIYHEHVEKEWNAIYEKYHHYLKSKDKQLQVDTMKASIGSMQ